MIAFVLEEGNGSWETGVMENVAEVLLAPTCRHFFLSGLQGPLPR